MHKRTVLNAAIIGTGNIGTDLLIKLMRSPIINCVLFAGRNSTSKGLVKARQLGVTTSDQSIQAIIDHADNIDIVFDATSAQDHIKHAPIFKAHGLKAIDLTPAEIGPFAIPVLSGSGLLKHDNVNMVTCGGQASAPIVSALSNVFPKLKSLKVCSTLSADSVGPATLANLDHYYHATGHALLNHSNFIDVDVHLDIVKSEWKTDMLTRLQIPFHSYCVEDCFAPLMSMLDKMRSYVPGYTIVGTPHVSRGLLEVLISVRGQGDWLPTFAGNLDIINCAAVKVAEDYALDSVRHNKLGALTQRRIQPIFALGG